MPFSSVDELPKGVKDNLPAHAQAIWMAAFNASYDGTCKGKSADDRDSCAAAIAWAAVKRKYAKGADGNWAEKSDAIAEFSMAIIKASFDRASGEMRWRAVASDTDTDLYDENMSLELFKDFVSRIENNVPVPPVFSPLICENGWCGGMPYLSISHYRSGGGKNLPGDVSSVYQDGNRLKAHGVLKNNDLGLAVFRALSKDLSGAADENTNPVRISIAFLDLKHEHATETGNYTFERKSLKERCPLCEEGIGQKTYLAGQLVHLAMTRVPVNPRTSMEVERMDDTIVTKKQDAESIIGELAEALVTDSQALPEDVLVLKANDVKHNPNNPKCECADCKKRDEKVTAKADVVVEPAPAPAAEATTEPKKEEVPAAVVEEAVMKKEKDEEHPASHYLVVEDPKEPSTWHLRVKDVNGNPDHHLMGGAWAALHGGYRGNKYEGPNKDKAIAKLTAMYKAEGIPTPSKSFALEDAFGALEEEVEKALTTGLYGDDGLKAVQPSFDALGKVLVAEFTREPEVVAEVPAQQDIAGIVRSVLNEVLPSALQTITNGFGAKLASLESRMDTGKQPAPKEPSVPAPRSLKAGPLKQASVAAAARPLSIRQIAEKSVGLEK